MPDLPDETFHNFRAPNSMDWWILRSSGTSCFKIFKGPVGQLNAFAAGWGRFPCFRRNCPTTLLTISKPRDQEIGESYSVRERRATDLQEAQKLCKGRSGALNFVCCLGYASEKNSRLFRWIENASQWIIWLPVMSFPPFFAFLGYKKAQILFAL